MKINQEQTTHKVYKIFWRDKHGNLLSMLDLGDLTLTYKPGKWTEGKAGFIFAYEVKPKCIKHLSFASWKKETWICEAINPIPIQFHIHPYHNGHNWEIEDPDFYWDHVVNQIEDHSNRREWIELKQLWAKRNLAFLETDLVPSAEGTVVVEALKPITKLENEKHAIAEATKKLE